MSFHCMNVYDYVQVFTISQKSLVEQQQQNDSHFKT